MDATFTAFMRKRYTVLRNASRGASITLSDTGAGFQAQFECAEKIEPLLKSLNLTTTEIGTRYVDECVLQLEIPYKSMCRALELLAPHHSVALIVSDGLSKTCFVRLPRTAPAKTAQDFI